MVGSIVQLNLYVNNIVACYNAAEHSALDTLIDSGNVFLGNSAADNRVDELVAVVLVREHVDLNVTVLTLTA